jgi:hypothetical protein
LQFDCTVRIHFSGGDIQRKKEWSPPARRKTVDEKRDERKVGMVLRGFEDYVYRHQRPKLHLGLALVL